MLTARVELQVDVSVPEVFEAEGIEGLVGVAVERMGGDGKVDI